MVTKSPSLNVPYARALCFQSRVPSLCTGAGLWAECVPHTHGGRPACVQHVPRARPEPSPEGCLINTLQTSLRKNKSHRLQSENSKADGKLCVVCGGRDGVTTSMGSELICCSNAQHSISLCLPLLGFRSGFSRLFGSERVIFQ